jgi:hypothetical protein
MDENRAAVRKALADATRRASGGDVSELLR